MPPKGARGNWRFKRPLPSNHPPLNPAAAGFVLRGDFLRVTGVEGRVWEIPSVPVKQ